MNNLTALTIFQGIICMLVPVLVAVCYFLVSKQDSRVEQQKKDHLAEIPTPHSDSYSHVWLYAKHHYVQSEDRIEDLKKVFAHRAGIKPEHMNLRDIVQMLVGIVSRHISTLPNPERRAFVLGEFLLKLQKHWLFQDDGRPYEIRLIDQCLSYMALVEVYDKAGNQLMIFEPLDETILPINRNQAA